jgi:hypothetical protein
MCDIDKDEKPTYEVAPFGTYGPMQNTAQALIAIDDQIDMLVALVDGEDLPEATNTAAINLADQIRAQVVAMLDALKLLMVNPEDLRALIDHSHAANTLHELAEQAMMLIAENETQEETTTNG